MNRNQVEQIVLIVLTTILKQPLEAGAEITRSNTPNWDSLKHIEIMFALEDKLCTEFSEEELSLLDSVTKIVDAALAKYAA